MVSSTENIGRLIANEVLLQADRQLLQNRDQPGQQATEKQPTTPPAPISHNEKAVSSVLLTLLDEQLDARLAGLADGFRNRAAAEPTSDTASGAGRVAAQYAEADAVFRPDFPIEQRVVPADASNQQVLLAAASPELRMAMQSAFFSAAVRAQTETEEISGRDARRRKLNAGPNGAVLIRIGLAGVAGLALAILIAAGLLR
ncbi:MAG: hypothetical protein JSR78_12490 [Proteobacteria bacterium]|nr:hypothetical protein [Pseudomonadota bacterium]